MNQMVENQIGLYSEVFPYQEKNKIDWKLISQKNSQMLVEATQGGNCSHIRCWSSFLWTGITFAFFQVLGWMQEFKEFRNIIDSGLSKDPSNILTFFMDISSWPWVLFTIKFLIILMTKFSEKETELILEFVKYTWFSGSLLPLTYRCTLFAEKIIKKFALALKSVTNLLLTKRAGISGTLLPL